MPLINTRVSVPLPQETESKLAAEYGKLITLIPGKDETYLMLTFEDECRIWFGGTKDLPAAMIEVKVFGKISEAVSDRMTAGICLILQKELNIPADRVYVKYEEVNMWGWNGGNF